METFKLYEKIETEKFKELFGDGQQEYIKEIFTEHNDGYYPEKYCGKLKLKKGREYLEIAILPAYGSSIDHMIEYIKKSNIGSNYWEDFLQKKKSKLCGELYDIAILFEWYARAVVFNNLAGTGYELKYGDKKDKITNNPSLYVEGKLEPDIVLYNEKKGSCWVFDVKYKCGEKKYNLREDRLQLMAYNLMWKCHGVGHIFPALHGDKSPVVDNTEILRKAGQKGVYYQFYLPSYDKADLKINFDYILGKQREQI